MNSLSVSVSIFYCVPISFLLETDTEIDRKLISNFENFSSENSYFRELVPGLEGANRRGLTRGFTEFDMSSLSVSVSIFYCVPLSFLLETDTEIDREFISNFENITSENSYFRE